MFAYLIAAALGWKFGQPVIDKVKGVLHRAPGGSMSLTLDADLPPALSQDVANLLGTMKNPAILSSAAQDYAARGFPLAAQALAHRAAQVSGGM